ncbi:MAG: 16S rRNA (cytidine(1402)-2'-O)-methyltransferase [Ignavibacterium sp.]|nr:16S rRNA (cytidine(1402)-2'-O)-methyltransferase [Ignavibacterium sp.]MDW8375590.1 16S rRNA (cytidine(1402)-2'-O)-methyltransferase [Ignavibacteriales bacterium]
MKLFIVSTSIGNLEDISFRAIKTLKNSDFIICEDTRISSILLKQYEIKKDLVSLNAFNEKDKIKYLIERIKSVKNVSLISDAGTPAISDPGSVFISECLKSGIDIIPVPGASALLSALVVSGLKINSFIFEGFLPQKKGREKKLKELASEKQTIIVYESVYRVEKLLLELKKFMPDRYIIVCKELTKKFEDVWRGYPDELIKMIPKNKIKGEFVFIISEKEKQ